jgi:hypothetical protein
LSYYLGITSWRPKRSSCAAVLAKESPFTPLTKLVIALLIKTDAMAGRDR